MKKGVLMNDLELGYAPLSAYQFSKIIKDKEFHKNVADSHIYVISQRNELTFNNIQKHGEYLSFEIWQEDNSTKVQCFLPLFQKHITLDKSKGIALRLIHRNKKNNIFNKPPFNGTQEIMFEELNIETGARKLIIWFTPEKLLQNYWKGYIQMKILGNFKKLLKYKVHYVGQSTEQNICNRLSKHSTFQEILMQETALSYGNIPSNEISILLIKIKDNISFFKWNEASSIKELTEYQLPNNKTVSLDAEKALIKYLQPSYNKILYKSFPKKQDLVNQDLHDYIFYSMSDPITLIYEKGEIKGSKLKPHRDTIIVAKSKT